MLQGIKTTGIAAVALFMIVATPAAAEETIVDIAVGNEDFSTLVDLVAARELAPTLAGEGPFTVFAPTNDAFARLPQFVGRALERNPELVTDVLLYHVVPGTLLAEAVLAEDSLTTAEGSDLRVRVAGQNAFVNTSRITATDIEASNGVIHVIDRVLVPNSVFQDVIDDARNQVRQLTEQLAARRGASHRPASTSQY